MLSYSTIQFLMPSSITLLHQRFSSTCQKINLQKRIVFINTRSSLNILQQPKQTNCQFIIKINLNEIFLIDFNDENNNFKKVYDFKFSEQDDQSNPYSAKSYEVCETQFGNKITISESLKNQNMIEKFNMNYQLFENINESEKTKQQNQYTNKTNNLIKNILKQYYKFLIQKQNIQLVSEFIFEKTAPYSVKLVKRYFDKINNNSSSLIKIIKQWQGF
ncbi:hypothetical protein ABPG72_011993 [Tetrahymena utriculariae]